MVALTHARQRLRLGISAVGITVLFSVVWLALLVGEQLPFTSRSLGADVARRLLVPIGIALAVFAVHALLLGGMEFRGGRVAVRAAPSGARWLRGYGRGVVVQGVLIVVASATLATGGIVAGTFGVVVGALLMSTLLLALQGPIARVGAAMSATALPDELRSVVTMAGIDPTAVRVVDAGTTAFVGGWIGVVLARLWIPAHWTAPEHRELLSVQLARREAQRVSGAQRRGLVRAALWPPLGLLLILPILPWSPSDATYWWALPAVATLWSFIGVLILPSASRPAVYRADAAAARALGPVVVQRTLVALDQWQDDEPERSHGVEMIFHPVPSRRNRERALDGSLAPAYGGGHQQARLTLFTGLGALSLLGRMVHCNLGIPALWVVYPGD